MDKNRMSEIKKEAIYRVDKWLLNSNFQEMTVSGSMMRFDMALGLTGYPFEKEEWMDKNDFNKFISDEEFNSLDYDIMMSDLLEYAREKDYKLNKNK